MVIKRVLISLDGSELAAQVVPHVLRFIAAEQTEVFLMTALSASTFPTFSHDSEPLTAEQIDLMNGGKACQQLDAVMQVFKKAGFKVQQQVLSGKPASSILQAAEEMHVELIAMSTHGRTGFGRALLGSVADEVVCHALTPIFLVPAKAVFCSDELPRVILLPLDGSPLAETAIPVAIQFAQNTGACVHLVRVVDTRDSDGEIATSSISSENDYADGTPVVQQAVAYLKRIQLRLQLAGVTTQYQVVDGVPAEAIARIAQAESADLIVMSTHGRMGVARQFYGSVASELISQARWPILMMRGKVSSSVGERDMSAVPSYSL